MVTGTTERHCPPQVDSVDFYGTTLFAACPIMSAQE